MSSIPPESSVSLDSHQKAASQALQDFANGFGKKGLAIMALGTGSDFTICNFLYNHLYGKEELPRIIFVTLEETDPEAWQILFRNYQDKVQPQLVQLEQASPDLLGSILVVHYEEAFDKERAANEHFDLAVWLNPSQKGIGSTMREPIDYIASFKAEQHVAIDHALGPAELTFGEPFYQFTYADAIEFEILKAPTFYRPYLDEGASILSAINPLASDPDWIANAILQTQQQTGKTLIYCPDDQLRNQLTKLIFEKTETPAHQISDVGETQWEETLAHFFDTRRPEYLLIKDLNELLFNSRSFRNVILLTTIEEEFEFWNLYSRTVGDDKDHSLDIFDFGYMPFENWELPPGSMMHTILVDDDAFFEKGQTIPIAELVSDPEIFALPYEEASGSIAQPLPQPPVSSETAEDIANIAQSAGFGQQVKGEQTPSPEIKEPSKKGDTPPEQPEAEEPEAEEPSPAHTFITNLIGLNTTSDAPKIRFQDREQMDAVLGVDALADELATIIQEMPYEQGRMMGIFGRWGRGKTFLVSKIWDRLKQTKRFHKVDFHAWKYQDTNAAWAYLYEKLADGYFRRPFNFFSKDWFLYPFRVFHLNRKREGLWPFMLALMLLSIAAGLVVGLFAIQSATGSDDETPYLLWGGVPIVSFSALLTIYKVLQSKHGTRAVNLLQRYTKQQSFSELLGTQSEVQKEIMALMQAWLPDGTEQEKVLLFVDDIDRCSEEKIIQLIDALRVILEEPEIAHRIIVLAAIDERILKRAIRSKYLPLLQQSGVRDGDLEKLPLLVSEYIDKLFLAGVKLGDLSGGERQEYLEALIRASADSVEDLAALNPKTERKEKTAKTEAPEKPEEPKETPQKVEERIEQISLENNEEDPELAAKKAKQERGNIAARIQKNVTGIGDTIRGGPKSDFVKEKIELPGWQDTVTHTRRKTDEEKAEELARQEASQAKDEPLAAEEKETPTEEGVEMVVETPAEPPVEDPAEELSPEEQKAARMRAEAEMLKECIELYHGATPRRIRIFYYRYLMAKSFLLRAYDDEEKTNPWFHEETASLLPRLIMYYSEIKRLPVLQEHRKEARECKDQTMPIHIMPAFTVSPDDYQEMLATLEMVIAY